MEVADMTGHEIKEILEKHLVWIKTDGKEGVRADLYRANLSGANLSGANLYRADLTLANLTIVWNKYCCLLSWQKNGTTCVRIGCECHPVEEWTEELQAELAAKHDQAWWDAHGRHIFAFLKEEAARYEASREV